MLGWLNKGSPPSQPIGNSVMEKKAGDPTKSSEALHDSSKPKPEVVVTFSADADDDKDVTRKGDHKEGSLAVPKNHDHVHGHHHHHRGKGSGQSFESRLSLDDFHPDNEDIEDHKTWEDERNGLISMIGFVVGISNVWKFPYLCWKFGGVTFLIPYLFFLITCAFPIMYLECIMGQLLHRGMVRVWKIAPLFKGVGICLCVLPFLTAFYLNAIYAWCLFYIVASVNHKVPWAFCTNDWNTPTCKDITPDFEVISLGPDERRAGEEYFKGRVQRVWKSVFAGDYSKSSSYRANASDRFGLARGQNGTDGDIGLGLPDWEMFLALFVVYFVTYIFTYKGFETKGKLVWFANFAPYLFVVILLYRAIGMPGTWTFGIKSFIYSPNKKNPKDGYLQFIYDYQTWIAAATQVFQSTGVGFGMHLTFASYNKFNRNCFKDVVVTIAVDTMTSIVFTIMVFMYVGTVVYSDGGQEAQLDEVLKEGPDLMFSVMADALGRLPGSYFFCTIFFFSIGLVGFTSTLSLIVCCKVSLFDGYNRYLGRHGVMRASVIILLLAVAYGAGIAIIARGGIDVFELFDHTTTAVPFFFNTLLMLFVFVYVYGIDLIVEGCERMTGRRPSHFTQFCLTYLCPLTLVVLIISFFIPNGDEDVINPTDEERYWRHFSPTYYICILVFQALPVFLLIIGAIAYVFSMSGKTWKQTFLMGISPPEDYHEIVKTNTNPRLSCKHLCKVMTYCFRKHKKVHPIPPATSSVVVSASPSSPIAKDAARTSIPKTEEEASPPETNEIAPEQRRKSLE